ncbi:MAG: sugar ABC transporter permease [Anaerolineae bacterium]|nr:sugar ABC transporter permease [Anaerolineae bacterium]
MTKRRWRETVVGYLFIMPVVLGLLGFTLGPMVASLYLSFTKFPLLRSPEWVGLKNYVDMFTRERYFWQALKVTITYAVTAVPLGLIGSFSLAMLLNQKVKGIAFFRTCFYMPTIVPAVASAVLWGWLLNPDYGLINAILLKLGLPTSRFLGDPKSALASLVLMSLWGIGGGMIIYLAGLQGIPESLYEAAKIDGANELQLFWNITVPMVTPTIFFNLVMGLIGSFQYFTTAFLLTNGGPLFSTYFYNLMLYERAFKWLEMGMASAMAWFLLVVVLLLTLAVFRSSGLWVYYETEVR